MPVSNKTVSRRPAVQADIPFLLDLRYQTMAAHLSASGVPVSEDEHLRRVLFRFECAEILLIENQPAGLLKVARDGQNWKLFQMQLSPVFQGLGIGTGLVREIVQEARQAGATLGLSVLRSNLARHLYERLGFSIVEEKPHSFEMQQLFEDLK
jgi:ribosomal protein S18 acetylase RimI-like enzyme